MIIWCQPRSRDSQFTNRHGPFFRYISQCQVELQIFNALGRNRVEKEKGLQLDGL